MSLHISIDLRLRPPAAFDNLMDELSMRLSRLGMRFEPGPGGKVTDGAIEVGRVVSWLRNERIVLEWRPANWPPFETSKMELRFEALEDGTRVTLEHDGLSNLLGDELAGWFGSEVAAPFLKTTGPVALGDWITDRKARRPSGPQSRAIYRDPLYHRPNFKVILNVLRLRPNDFLLEVGCGGGAFLADALQTGCKAAAIDHSPDMVRLAREVNRDAIREGRLEIREGDARSLPFPDGTFTCAVMTGVFGFIANPLEAISEVRRVLAEGGRFVLFTGSKEMRGTPAAPEPMASRLHFYEDAELEDLARQAGFGDARLDRPDFTSFAREVGVPEEHMPLFSARGGGQLLVARRA